MNFVMIDKKHDLMNDDKVYPAIVYVGGHLQFWRSHINAARFYFEKSLNSPGLESLPVKNVFECLYSNYPEGGVYIFATDRNNPSIEVRIEDIIGAIMKGRVYVYAKKDKSSLEFSFYADDFTEGGAFDVIEGFPFEGVYADVLSNSVRSLDESMLSELGSWISNFIINKRLSEITKIPEGCVLRNPDSKHPLLVTMDEVSNPFMYSLLSRRVSENPSFTKSCFGEPCLNLELFYEEGKGVFAMESEILNNLSEEEKMKLVSPYSGQPLYKAIVPKRETETQHCYKLVGEFEIPASKSIVEKGTSVSEILQRCEGCWGFTRADDSQSETISISKTVFDLLTRKVRLSNDFMHAVKFEFDENENVVAKVYDLV